MLLGGERSHRCLRERQNQQVDEQDRGSIPRLNLSAESREKAELVGVIHPILAISSMLETESGKNSTVGKIIWLCLVKKFRSKFSAAQIKEQQKLRSVTVVGTTLQT